MANPDRPNGFKPVKAMSGAPWNMLVRSVGVTDAADIFVGDALKIASGLALKMTTGAACLGVAVGFGRTPSGLMGEPGPWDVTNLENKYYEDAVETHTEWVVYYVPAEGVLFEAQTALALDLGIGETADIADGGGSTTNGMSGMELTTSSSADVVVVEHVTAPDNDTSLTNARHLVAFTSTVVGQS